MAWRHFFSRRLNVLVVAWLLAYVVMALAAPWLSPAKDPANPAPFKVVGRISDRQPHPPAPGAPLGTLPGQFSVFHTLVWGARDALGFGLLVAASTALIGVVLGAASGYFEGLLGGLVMRVSDAFLAFPVIVPIAVLEEIPRLVLEGYRVPVVPIFVNPVLQESGPLVMMLVLFSWMPYARLTQATIRQLKQTEFVVAARALGASEWRILVRHLLPNALLPAIVLVARDVGGMVILAATLTFIGLGGFSAWGELLVVARSWIIGPAGNVLTYWWVYLPVTLALVLFGAGWSLLGDALAVALNPRARA